MNMAEKQPFDPRKHLFPSAALIDFGSSTSDCDLAVAHQLQQEMYDEERKVEREDMKLARRMHDEEQKRSVQNDLMNDQELNENSNWYSQDMAEVNDWCREDVTTMDDFGKELNKDTEEESLALAKRLNFEEQKSHYDIREDEDRKMAMRIQEQEESKLGSLNSEHSSPVTPLHEFTDETEEDYMRKIIQEQEDEELARSFQLEEEAADNKSREPYFQSLGGDTQDLPKLQDDFIPELSEISPVDISSLYLDENEMKPSENDQPLKQYRPKNSARNASCFPSSTPTLATIPEGDCISTENEEKNEEKRTPPEENTNNKLPHQPLSSQPRTNSSAAIPKSNVASRPKMSTTPLESNKKKKRSLFSRLIPRGKKGEIPNLKIVSPPPPPIPKPKNEKQPRYSRSVICDICGEKAYHYLSALGKNYHPECFLCTGCSAPIKSTDLFAFYTNDEGEKFPLHKKCHAELFGIKCSICKNTIPYGENGQITFVKHPFFPEEQMCPEHMDSVRRRCTGCNRFEPEGIGFTELYDANRCLCNSCSRTVIVDSEDVKPLWKNVIEFFEQNLGLTVWDGLREVPVLAVGYETLNDSSFHSAHSGSSQIMTRGLCLSEHQSGRKINLAPMRYDKKSKSFEVLENQEKEGFTYFQIPDSSKANKNTSVTAILCLSGLPSDLTASVLAHEATHAWLKLHPNFDIKSPIPLEVEEGCCQLVANLFLREGLEAASMETVDDGPSDASLRQYFLFAIETDEHEVYGVGYRKAAQVCAKIGLQALLAHVAMYRNFPEV